MTRDDAVKQGFEIGRIKWFNPSKGFGFILPDAGGGDVFLHASVTEKCGYGVPIEAQQVAYRSREGNKGVLATEVYELEGSA